MAAIGKLMVQQAVQQVPLRRKDLEGRAAVAAPLRAGERLLGAESMTGGKGQGLGVDLDRARAVGEMQLRQVTVERRRSGSAR